MESTTVPEIYYPECDGEPMGETQLHIGWTIRLLQQMERRYAGEQVLVGSNLIFYWVEGHPWQSVVPDVFVVLDCDPQPPRRTFRTWDEGRVPNIVFEVTSKKTKQQDEEGKPAIYMEMGVPEYVMYDPTADYLDPPLQMLRMVDGRYERVSPDSEGRFFSEELDLVLRLVNGLLEVRDRTTGEVLLTPTEAETEIRREALIARQRELAAREEAESQRTAREAAEAEIARLRAKLAELGDGDTE